MDKVFLIPLGFALLGIVFCKWQSRPWLSPFLVATSMATFPIIFWGVRSQGPFFGGADIGAGLILILSSIIASILIVIIFAKKTPWPNIKAAKYSAMILVFNISVAMLNHMLLLKQKKEYELKSEINCETMPYHCAIKENKISEIEVLKKAGRPIDAKDGWGRTALLHAYYTNNSFEFINELIKHGADVNQVDESGLPMIRIVLSSNPPNFKLADLLLSNRAQANSLFGYPKRISLLNDAVIRKNNELVNYLLAKGAQASLLCS